jgi:hypothetical protein
MGYNSFEFKKTGNVYSDDDRNSKEYHTYTPEENSKSGFSSDIIKYK